MESILTSIKKLLGIPEEYAHFDVDIIMHINSVFMTLNQLGVGPREGFIVKDDSQTWSEFLGTTNVMQLEAAKTYTYLNVKMIFDSSSMSSSVLDAYKRQSDEYAWRLIAQVEGKE